MVMCLISRVELPISTLFVLMEFCEKDARCWKNWWEFPHENHWQVRDCVFVVAHPSFGFFFLDEFNELPGKLVEVRFGL